MIDLQQYKIEDYDYPSQLIFMDFSGRIMQSCNSIFDTFTFQSQSIVKEVPFLESIFHIVKTHVPGTPEILFKKVESPFYLLRGIYDFTFSTLKVDNQLLIRWTIFDKTSYYDNLIKNQQRRNELEIKRQLRNSNFFMINKVFNELQDALFVMTNLLSKDILIR